MERGDLHREFEVLVQDTATKRARVLSTSLIVPAIRLRRSSMKYKISTSIT